MPPRHRAGWSYKRIEVLKKLWQDGATASDIASALGGGVTRSAVLGKIHHLGLKRPRAPPACLPKPEVVTTSTSPVGGVPEPSTPLPSDPFTTQAPLMLSLMELSGATCRWPVGSGDPQRFCGHPVGDGVYCAEHAQASRPKVATKLSRHSARELERSLRRFI